MPDDNIIPFPHRLGARKSPPLEEHPPTTLRLTRPPPPPQIFQGQHTDYTFWQAAFLPRPFSSHR
jgi:hypothetical protein